MRTALQGVQPRNQVSDRMASVGAPVGGLNARDSLAAMAKTDALILDNFVCRATTVDIRKGQQVHVSGFSTGEVVESLLSYRASPNDRMFAATDKGIYDVTVAGTVGPKVAESTEGRWEFIEGTNAGLHYLLAVNGKDPMKLFNGAEWKDAIITGGESNKFTNISNFKFRNYFCKKDSLSFWFLDVNAVQGAVQEFPLGPIFLKGGSLQAILNWSVDGGGGQDDYFTAITSEGEVAIYKGSDPTNADNWALVGVYNLPRPIGKRCLFKFGGDIVVITEQGIVKMTSVLQAVTINRQSSISDRIIGLLNSAALNYKKNLGWQLVSLASESLLILNVPTLENETAIQYAMNTSTGAWSSLSGLNATCFLELGGRLFYGKNGAIVQAFVTNSDFGANITAKAKMAFSAFGQPSLSKQVKLVRLNYRTSKAVSVGLSFAINYEEASFVTSANSSPQQQAHYDLSLWDTARWAGADFVVSRWRTVFHKPGYTVSLVMQVSDKDYTFVWNQTDYLLASGFAL